ncbi:acyl carrier protein phosphodiesterase [Pseudoalteromonas mariniglutinosa]
MNYLAHLYLAQPTADSHFGNLLGDFGGQRQLIQIPDTVKNALDNHYLVDKFTDTHPLVKEAKQYFSPKRKRFAGVAIDVMFDHFLIQHWQRFNEQPLSEFKKSSFALLGKRIPIMPVRMQRVVTSMTRNDWFKEYETISGVGLALDNIAARIRFANTFTGAAEDIARYYSELDEIFLAFFPALIEHVNYHALENS